MKGFINVAILLIIILFSCRTSDNCGNRNAVETFNKHLRAIEKHKAGQAIDGKVYFSLFFLETVTNTNSSASYGDISYYENQDSIDNDIVRWRNWLQENKCDLNLDSLKKIEKHIKETNPWMGGETD